MKFQIEEEKNRRLFDSVLKEDKTTITNDLDWRKVDEKLIGSTIIADKKSPNKECDSFKENKAGDDVINELEHELENANPNQVKSEKQETLGAKPEKLKVKIAGGEVPKIVNIDRQKIQNNECVQQ